MMIQPRRHHSSLLGEGPAARPGVRGQQALVNGVL